MIQTIQNKLREIEKDKDIKILFAIESGSRGWGFSSTDSDYDVRFIYTRSLNDYLKINLDDDFLDYPINDELDINGWDLKKFFKLLYASNATPFEWIQSPIYYTKDACVINEINNILPSFFCQQTLMHHYLGLVKKKIEQLQVEDIKLKNLFYVVRSLLAAKYSLVKEKYPPMQFDALVFLIEDEAILNELMMLRDKKKEVTESYTIKISSKLKNYIYNLYVELSSASKVKSKGAFDENLINQTYLNLITYADNRFFKTK